MKLRMKLQPQLQHSPQNTSALRDCQLDARMAKQRNPCRQDSDSGRVRRECA